MNPLVDKKDNQEAYGPDLSLKYIAMLAKGKSNFSLSCWSKSNKKEWAKLPVNTCNHEDEWGLPKGTIFKKNILKLQLSVQVSCVDFSFWQRLESSHIAPSLSARWWTGLSVKKIYNLLKFYFHSHLSILFLLFLPLVASSTCLNIFYPHCQYLDGIWGLKTLLWVVQKDIC